jgi:hypothetical protein
MHHLMDNRRETGNALKDPAKLTDLSFPLADVGALVGLAALGPMLQCNRPFIPDHSAVSRRRHPKMTIWKSHGRLSTGGGG